MRGKLGILAGGGSLPAQLIATCRAQGREILILGFKNQADPGLSVDFWVRLGAAGEVISRLKEADVTELVMIGRVSRPGLTDMAPDWRLIRFVFKLLFAGDDGLLRQVLKEFAQEGIEVVGIHQLMPELLLPEGDLLGFCSENIDKGIKSFLEWGRKDKGQALVIKDGQVIAWEGKKGTDAMLKSLTPAARGGILVKGSKPGQELRVDMPTLGPNTISNAAKAGLIGIVGEAGRTLLVEKEETLKLAAEKKIFIKGIKFC